MREKWIAHTGGTPPPPPPLRRPRAHSTVYLPFMVRGGTSTYAHSRSRCGPVRPFHLSPGRSRAQGPAVRATRVVETTVCLYRHIIRVGLRAQLRAQCAATGWSTTPEGSVGEARAAPFQIATVFYVVQSGIIITITIKERKIARKTRHRIAFLFVLPRSPTKSVPKAHTNFRDAKFNNISKTTKLVFNEFIVYCITLITNIDIPDFLFSTRPIVSYTATFELHLHISPRIHNTV